MFSDLVASYNEMFIILPFIGIITVFYYIKKITKTSKEEKLYNSTKYRDLHHYKRNESNLEMFIS